MKDVTSVFDLETAASRTVAVVNALRWQPEPAVAAALAAEVFTAYGETGVTVTEADGAALLAAAGELRAVFAAGDDDPDAAARLLNALLARCAGPPRLTAHGGTPWHLHVDRDDDAPWDEWLLAGGALALAALLAAAGDRPAFGVCGAADCRMCYLDSGRGGGRRYCSSRCATRTRVAAFRAKAPTT